MEQAGLGPSVEKRPDDARLRRYRPNNTGGLSRTKHLLDMFHADELRLQGKAA